MSNDNTRTPGTMVTLVSSDDQEFHLTTKGACLSLLVVNALGKDGSDGDDDNDDEAHNNNNNNNNNNNEQQQQQQQQQRVDILKVPGCTLEKVVAFLNHYSLVEKFNEVPTPMPEDTLEGNVTQEWYRNFILRMDRDETFAMMQAANYMDIKPLLDLVVLRITFEISGKPVDQIKKYLKLPPTPLQQQQSVAAQDEKNQDNNDDNDDSCDKNNNYCNTAVKP